MSHLIRLEHEEASVYANRIHSEFRAHYDAMRPDKVRESRNWGLYSGVNDRQWDAAALHLLRSEGRPANTYNVVQGIIDTIAGIFRQNPMNTYYESQYPSSEKVVNLAQWLFDFESARGKWSKEEAMFIVAGLIYQGVAQWSVDYSRDSHGNCSWRNINPLKFVEDSHWSTNDIHDARLGFREDWYDPNEISFGWSSKKEAILSAVKMMQTSESARRKVSNELNEDYHEVYKDGKFKVIECHFMSREAVSFVVDLDTGEHLKGATKDVAEAMVLKDPGRYKKIVEESGVSRVATVVPGLPGCQLLSAGKYPLQMGHIPFSIWSAKNLFGEKQGVVDLIADAQVTLNKRQSSLLNWEATNANGSWIGDERYFPDQDTRDDIVANGHRPGKFWWGTSEGMNGDMGRAIVAVPSSEPPGYLSTGTDAMINMMDRLASMQSALRPGQGTAGANGKHFAELLQQSLVPFEIMSAGLQGVLEARADDFLPVAKYIYMGPERRLKRPDSTKSLIINQLSIDEDGEVRRSNSIDEIDQYDYTVKHAPNGQDAKERGMAEITGALQYSSVPTVRTEYEKQMVQYTDANDDEKVILRQDCDEYKEFQREQVRSQTAQLRAARIQSEMAISQMSKPAAPGPGGMVPPGPDAKAISKGPGQGDIPDAAGIAGSASSANNNQRPSDMGSRR